MSSGSLVPIIATKGLDGSGEDAGTPIADEFVTTEHGNDALFFVRIKLMAKTRSTLTVLLLLVWMAAPALRCLIPGEVLSAEEQACCKSMGGQCDDSSEPSHPCCKHSTLSAQPALATSQAAPGVLVMVATALPRVVDLIVALGFAPAWIVDPSPPPNHARASSVLRI